LVPGIDDTDVPAFMDVPRDTLCLVLAFSGVAARNIPRLVDR
jgi:hypothetical protein